MKPIANSVRAKLALMFLVAATAALVVLGVLSFARKVETFQAPGVALSVTPLGWQVESSHPDSELRSGDILMLVDGVEITPSIDAAALLTERDEIEVVAVREEVLVQLRHSLPPIDLDVPYLMLAFLGVSYLFIGLYTLLRGIGKHSALFHTWCLVSTALYLLSANLPPADSLDRLIYTVDEISRLLLPPLTLHFFLVFPKPLFERLRRLLPFIYLPALSVAIVQLDQIVTNGALLGVPPTDASLFLLDRIGLAQLIVLGMAAVAALAIQATRTESLEQGRQILWIGLGMAFGYIPFAALYLVPFSLGANPSELVQTIAVAPLVLVPLSFAWAILRYRLWDITIIVRDITTYTITFLLGGLGFSLVNLLVRRSIPDDFELTRNLSTIAGGLLIAGLMLPAKQGIGATLERFHYRGVFSRRRTLTQLGEELLHDRDLESLSSSLLIQLEEAMALQHSNLFLVDQDRLVPLEAERDLLRLSGRRSLDLTSIDESLWSRELVRIDSASLPGQSDGLTTLWMLGYRVAFPLSVRERRIGLLVTGLKEGKLPLTSDDTLLIRQLLNQAALAIENAQLLEHLQRQLNEVIELKQFNEEIIESSPAGIAVLDKSDRVVTANLSFSALVGVELGGVKHRSVSDLLTVPELPEPEGGTVDVNFVDHAGKTRYLQLSMASLVGEPGNPMKVLVANDVTERVLLERTLQEQERLAALGVMAAGVAHEVNTPLTGISSYAQMLLQRTNEQDPSYEILKKIERQTFRASSIVNNLLELSRASRADAELVAIDKVIDESVDLLRIRFADEGIAVAWQHQQRNGSGAGLDHDGDNCGEGDKRDHDDLLVKGHEGELLQVFNNLLANAADAFETVDGANGRDATPAKVSIELEATDDRLVARVIDNGPGIAPEHLTQVFEPFFSTRLGDGGTGLGLSISHEIVRRHGGTLKAANREEGGCVFEVVLPKARRDDSSDQSSDVPVFETERGAS